MKLAEKYLRKTEMRVNLFGRYHFSLDLNRGDLESSFFYFLPELYEPETQRYIRDHIKPGMTGMDIGAHVGFFSLLMADRVTASGKVYSFEPEEKNFKRLSLNLESNHFAWAEPYHAALAEKSGSEKLFLHATNTGNFLASALAPPVQTDLTQFQDVNVTSLDDFIDEHQLEKIDLMKIDAEGSESGILAGAHKTFSSGIVSRVICEVQKPPAGGLDPVRYFFYSFGYRSFFLNPKISGSPYMTEFKAGDPVRGRQNVVFEKGF